MDKSTSLKVVVLNGFKSLETAENGRKRLETARFDNVYLKSFNSSEVLKLVV